MNDHLDNYIALLQQHRPLGKPGLSVYELAALLEFAGRFAGFEVESERIVKVNVFGHPRRPEIDCVWTIPGNNNIVVAWEIDCINVLDSHLEGATIQPDIDALKAPVGNMRKFEASNARICVQALYSYRAGKQVIDRSERVSQFYREHCRRVRVLTDITLLQGTLATIIAEAQS